MKKSSVNFLLLVLLSGCTTLVKIKPSPVNPAEPDNKLGELHIPQYKQQDFVRAADLVIQIINSPAFATEINNFVRLHANGGEYSQAWAGWTSARIVTEMRACITGVKVETYGGPIAWYNHVFNGNIAYDGTTGDVVRMNRTGMRKRSIADLCNTIAHEVAHHAGMTHPHSEGKDKNVQISRCEPPYVIGSIVKKLAAGDAWVWDADDCVHMRPAASN